LHRDPNGWGLHAVPLVRRLFDSDHRPLYGRMPKEPLSVHNVSDTDDAVDVLHRNADSDIFRLAEGDKTHLRKFAGTSAYKFNRGFYHGLNYKLFSRLCRLAFFLAH